MNVPIVYKWEIGEASAVSARVEWRLARCEVRVDGEKEGRRVMMYFWGGDFGGERGVAPVRRRRVARMVARERKEGMVGVMERG